MPEKPFYSKDFRTTWSHWDDLNFLLDNATSGTFLCLGAGAPACSGSRSCRRVSPHPVKPQPIAPAGEETWWAALAAAAVWIVSLVQKSERTPLWKPQGNFQTLIGRRIKWAQKVLFWCQQGKRIKERWVRDLGRAGSRVTHSLRAARCTGRPRHMAVSSGAPWRGPAFLPGLGCSEVFTWALWSWGGSEKSGKLGTDKTRIRHAKLCSKSKTENLFVGRS